MFKKFVLAFVALAFATFANAQSMPGVGVGRGSQVIVSAFGSFPANQTPGSTTGTLPSVAFGTALDDRYVVTGFFALGASLPTISGVTIGGVTATQIAVLNGATITTQFWSAKVPASVGTSGNIVVTSSVAMTQLCGTAWNFTGLRIPFTPIATTSGAGAASPAAVASFAANADASFAVIIARGINIASSAWTTNAVISNCLVANPNSGMAISTTPTSALTPTTNLTVSASTVSWFGVTLQ